MSLDHVPVHVSVIIPCYNGERFLPELLRSFQAQTEPADEIVVVESYSTDRSLDILHSFSRSLPLRIEQRPREGIYPAWNEGVRLVSYPLCYIACVDDVVYPDAMRQLRRFRRVAPESELYTWRIDVIDDQGKVVAPGGSPIVNVLWRDWANKPHRRPGTADSLTTLTLGSPYLSMMGVAFTRSLWEATGGFPTQYGSAGDLAWQVQAGLRTTVAYLPWTLAAWRVHEQSATIAARGGKEFSILQGLVQDYLPIVQDRLGVPNQCRERVVAELVRISRQTRALTLLSRLARSPSRKGIALLSAQCSLALVVWMLGQVLCRRAMGRRESSLAIPAAGLRKVLQELRLADLQELDYPDDPHAGKPE
jgi:hypothetical protein